MRDLVTGVWYEPAVKKRYDYKTDRDVPEYRGLVIAPGHPMDGKYMSHDRDLHESARIPRLSDEERMKLLTEFDPKEQTVVSERLLLRWKEGLRFRRDKEDSVMLNVWVPLDHDVEPDPIVWAVRQLTEAYSTARACGRTMEDANFVPTYRHGQEISRQLTGAKDNGPND